MSESPINKWAQWLAKAPNLATLNEFLHEIGECEQEHKQPVWNMVYHYATGKGWTFDRDTKVFK